MVRGHAKEAAQQKRAKMLAKQKKASSNLKTDTNGDWAAAQKEREAKKAAKEEAKKKKEEHEKAWANAPAPAIPEEPPFEDDDDLEAFFASRNVQTPLQRFDQLQADNAIAAAKKVLDEKEYKKH